MKLLFRLIDGTGTPHDIEVDVAEDLRVGELADALAARSGASPGCTIATRWPRTEHCRTVDRDALVVEHGPRLGATIELVDRGDAAPSVAPLAPVQLVAPDGRRRQLRFGANDLGGVRIDVGHQVVARSTRGGTAAAVNGERLLGSRRLAASDLVTVAAQTWSLQLGGTLRPPAPAGPTVPHRRTPRRLASPAPVTVELPSLPPPLRLPGFPVLSAAVPLLMGAALWFATRSIASVVFVLFSFVFVVASGVEARREARAERAFRVQEFRADLDAATTRIDTLRAAQRARAERLARGVDVAAESVRGQRERLWEGVDGSAVVRLGAGAIEPFDPVRAPSGGDRALRRELSDVVEASARVDGPVTLDVGDTGGLAIIGADEMATGVARSLVVQLATVLAPEQLRIEVRSEPGRERRWQWCRWLPHVGASAPRTLLVADGLDASDLEAEPDGAARTLIWIAPRDAGVPDSVRAVLRVDGTGGARLLRHDELRGWTSTDVTELESATEDEVEPLARLLAPVRSDLVGPTVADGATTSLRSLLARPDGLDDPSTIRRVWSSSDRARLGAPIGRAGGDVVQIDLCADGPHALIAGTTGAGKSEVLRTLIVSLALHHGPQAVTFLLVDYKGGAAFGELDALPHTVGMITDLSGPLATRALTSLRAEVRRREEVLAAHRSSALTELPESEALPALVVVVDEFATLARELPEFVEGLVDVAQRGRSLGVHLVLATQRPAGVVSDAIRANTTLRLALRVADEDDSRDVVDSPDAASIPRDRPGRAIVRVGPGTSVEVQTAYCGSPAAAPPRIRFGTAAASTCADRSSPDRTERLAAVAAVRAAAVGTPPPRRPWLDPLPAHVELRSVPSDAGPGRLALGLVDLPAAQAQRPLVVDLERDGGVLICGASGSGRSGALSILAAATARHPSDRFVVHGIDAGRALQRVGERGLVADVLDAHDHERVLRLLRSVAAELHDGRVRAPRRLVLLDGFAGFEEAHEQLNRGEAIELLTRIAREGRAARVHLAVTAARPTELPATLRASLGAVVQLQCANEDDASLAGLPASAADRDLPPGRAVVDGAVAQLAAPDTIDGAVTRRVTAEIVGRLPDDLDLDRLVQRDAPLQRVLGVDADRLEVASMDLTHHHALVVGPPRCGRTTALATLGRGMRHVHRIGGRDGVDLQTISATIDAAIAAAADGPALLAVDDLPELLECEHGASIEAALLAVLDAGRQRPVRLVAAGEVDAMTRCYGELVGRLRSERTGLVLQGDPELHGALLHATVRSRGELPGRPGRGWLVHPGRAQVVQVARPT